MTAKLLWEFAAYWAVVALPFFEEKIIDADFNKEVGGDVRRIITAGARLEDMFRDWHELGQLEWRDAFISNRSFPAFWDLHLDLDKSWDDDSLKERYTHNADNLEAIAVILFHKALERLPDASVDADTKVNPAGIGLDPDRWEKDKLLDGAGVSLTEARERVPGIEKMLLAEVASPA